MRLLGKHCCQVSPRFLRSRPISEIILQNTENFLHSQFSIFTCSEKEIFFIQPKFKTPKIDLLAKLLLKKLKIIRKYFPAPTLPLFVKIGGRRATNFPRPKVTYSGPFWVILHKFWTLVNSIRKVNNDERVHSMYTFVEPRFPIHGGIINGAVKGVNRIVGHRYF